MSLLELQSNQGRGHQYSGVVRNVQPYGAFVRFGDGAHVVAKDGLLRTRGLRMQLRAGDEVRVWVKSVNAREGKIALALC